MSDEKLDRILDKAGELFASRPFHKVLLSDVASAANVGKGTLYLYIKSKEELYLAVLYRGFSKLLDRLRACMASCNASPEKQLRFIVRELVYSLYANSTITELLRGAVIGCPKDSEWIQKRMELRELIENVIRKGVDQGVFTDPHPELTSQYIPGIIRSVAVFRPQNSDVETVCDHAQTFVLNSLLTTRISHE